jgi:cytoskeletal protein RodZ
MRKTGGIAALATVLVVLCAVIALEWYAHVAGSSAAPQPVQQIAAASSSPAPTDAPTATPQPLVYVPKASASPITTSAPASPAPAASSSAAATSTPMPTPTPYRTSQTISEEPMVAATLAPHISRVKPIAEPPDAPPRILSMSLSTPVAHGGQVVSGTVETTSNVASVEARIGGYSTAMQKVGVGKFVMSYTVPHLPFFLHRTYNIEVIARNTKGEAVRSSVPITIR